MMLDDPREIGRIDASGMLDVIVRTGPMLAEGWRTGEGIALPPRPPENVVVSGLGGSAIGGDLLATLLAPSSGVPVVCVRDERLPAFVGPGTLLFACSYSGHTEETLAAYEAARGAGASIVAVTSGGRLAEAAAANGDRLAMVRAGFQPRAALPLLLMPMLRVTARCGLIAMDDRDVSEAHATLGGLASQWRPEVPAEDNPAKALAQALRGTVPAVYAGSPRLEAVARRWKGQFNENSKVFAVANVFPELVHNEIVGWEGVRDGNPPLHVIILRDHDDGVRSAARIEAARAVGFRRARGSTEIWTQGSRTLTRLLSLVLFGDLVSVYLAVLAGVDPTPVEPIARIKERLSRA
jgi:glucose/mannose-6-phosphate isomerase